MVEKGCAQVRAMLLAGRPIEDDALAAHVKSCPPCAQLASEKGALAGHLRPEESNDELDLEHLLSDTMEQIDRDDRSIRGWLRSRPTWMRILLALVVCGGVISIGGSLMARPDLATYPRGRMLMTIFGLGAFLSASIVMALRPIHRPALPGWANTALTTVGVLVAFLIAIVPLSADAAKAMDGGGLTCLYFGVLAGVPVYAAVRLLDRGGNPISAVLAASGAGLTGNLFLHLKCAATTSRHLLLGHFPVVISFLAAIGVMLMFERWIQRRSDR